MAKQFSPNAIRPQDDWTIDTRNNLPYSGLTIQNYIKERIGQSVGAAYFDQSNYTLYFFNTIDDRNTFENDTTRTDLIVSSTVLSFESEMRRVYVENNLPSYDIQAATNQTEVNVSLNFDVQRKEITDTEWTSTGEGVNVTVYIDRGSVGNYVLIPEASTFLRAGTTFTFNTRQYLASGANRVKVTFTSESQENPTTASVVYSISLSEMYIEELNNGWYNAIIEGVVENYKLGGFKIVGALSKTLNLEIWGSREQIGSTITKFLGTSSYVDTPYNYTRAEGLDLENIIPGGLPTGVYTCKAYLTAGSLRSLPISFNFMYVTAADRNLATTQLVCVNSVASVIYNYSDNTLCHYALYNAGLSEGSPHLDLSYLTGSIPTEKENRDIPGVSTGVDNTLVYTVEWLIDVDQSIQLGLYFGLSYGNTSSLNIIPIDNSAVYPAETGAAFYMNASTRSNNDTNRSYIVNEATVPTTTIQATWEKMAWVDGIDGWTVDPSEKISNDDAGRRALLVPAGSKCTIPYQMLTGEDMTFEICYKVANVSNYDENVITIAENPTSSSFKGLVITPNRFYVHSSDDTQLSDNTTRSKILKDEEIVHLLLTIQNSYGGNTGKNLATVYINGCKSLQFYYASGVSFRTVADLIIGSSTADVYVYLIRAYCGDSHKALGTLSAEQNYINSLRTLTERETASALFNSVRKSSGIDYESVVNSSNNYNVFVVEMKDGATVPSRANRWGKKQTGFSDIEMHYGAHPEWDWKIYNVETGGQGTTSMNYYRWNIRWRIDKNPLTSDHPKKQAKVAYYDAPTVGVDGKKVYHERESANATTVTFDGIGNHPGVMRITAKINQASSMQSHKIGATRAYDVLSEELGLENEAQAYASLNSLPRPTVAVYQYPAFGFSRRKEMGQDVYEFIGLFTIGPDKGDKPTFGYDISSIKNNLITLEGKNHAPLLAVFQYPWNSNVSYSQANESINVVLGNSNVDDAWEVSNCCGLDIGDDHPEEEADINEVLAGNGDDYAGEFKPAYDVVWENSTQIFPVALDDATYGGANAAAVLANINAHIAEFRDTQYTEKLKYSDMQFWIEGEYILYYYEEVPDTENNLSARYVADINLVTQNGSPSGSTLEEKNEWFKAQRRARFLSQAPNYWDVKDSIYHLVFCELFGATDNFAKNTYPYKMAPLASGGRWKWRQDDLDTIFDIDNLGKDSKPYQIEFKDGKAGGAVFGGGNSVFWNLLYETFWNDYGINKGIESIGKDVVNKMISLGSGANAFEKLVNFFKRYFWDNAQYYFPQSAYNTDASFKYEDGWLDTRTDYNQPEALDQSLGRHLEAEKVWCTNRAIYIMSMFKVGPFGDYTETSLGRITFRPGNAGFKNPTITPTLWMYPPLFYGERSPESTERIEAGHSKEFTGNYGDGNTNVYLEATNYMESLGDWKDLTLSESGGYVRQISVVGAKLRNFKIGEPNIYYTQEEIDAAQSGDAAYGKTTSDIKTAASVTTNVPSLEFSNTKCLEEIEARNAESLTGTIDLSNCTRLLRAYFEGTKTTQIVLPDGSKITKLHLSDYTNTLVLKNLKFLTDLKLPSDISIISRLQVENCTNQDAFEMLKDCYDSTDSSLRDIRLIWSGIDSANSADVHMLANIAADKDKDDNDLPYGDGYRGINASGNVEGKPIIEGTLQLSTGMYTDDLALLNITQEEDYGSGLKRALSSIFGTLFIIYDPSRLYISFVDPEVASVCINNWSTDGYGLTLTEAANVTSISGAFRNNTSVSTFDEFKYFTGITSMSGAFRDSTFTKITFPDGIQIGTTSGNWGTALCSSSLQEVDFGDCVRAANAASSDHQWFMGCSSLTKVHFKTVKQIIDFAYTGGDNFNRNVIFGYNSNTNSHYVYVNGEELINAIIPEDVENIRQGAFYRFNRVETIDMPSTTTTIGNQAFAGCLSLESVICRAVTPPTLSNNAFNSTNSTFLIYVPYSADHSILTAYQAATNWISYASQIFELDASGNIPTA